MNSIISYDYDESYSPRDYMREYYYHLVNSPSSVGVLPIATRFYWNDIVDYGCPTHLYHTNSSSTSTSYPLRQKSYVDTDSGCSTSSPSSYFTPSYSFPVSMVHPVSSMNHDNDDRGSNKENRDENVQRGKEIDKMDLHEMDEPEDIKLEMNIYSPTTKDDQKSHDDQSSIDENRINPHHQKTKNKVVGESKLKKIKKRAPRNNWKKMTKELFNQMVDYEKQHPNIKQCDLQRLFNVNRSTYWRWKKQFNMI